MKTSTPPKRVTPDPQPLPRALPPGLAAGLVFIASGAVLVLEILSVRLLAPYVGLTLETTTAIIGAVLAGIAVGARLGGWIADRTDARWLVVLLLIGGGLLVLLTVPIVRAMGPAARDGGTASALEVTFAALVPLAAVLSAVSPTVAHLQLHDLRTSGTVVGRLSAWATAGALVGTFATGFVLVPLFPVSATVLAIGIALVAVGVLLGAYTGLLRRGKVVGTVVGTLAIAVLTPLLHVPCDAETAYHCVRVIEDLERPVTARVLLLDGGYNSAVDLQNPRILSFPYTRWIADAIDATTPASSPVNAVFVGGAGFTLPRWLRATHPRSRSDVLEVDGELIDFDRQHLGLRTSPNLRAKIGDARITMRDEPSASANVVVGDAFSSRTVPWQLMTIEWLREVKRVLRPGGIYTLNVIDYPPLKLLRAEAATLLEAFSNLHMITLAGQDGQPEGGNEILVASNRSLPPKHEAPPFNGTVYDRAAIVRLISGAKPLRDDYAPVDQLETRPD